MTAPATSADIFVFQLSAVDVRTRPVSPASWLMSHWESVLTSPSISQGSHPATSTPSRLRQDVCARNIRLRMARTEVREPNARPESAWRVATSTGALQ